MNFAGKINAGSYSKALRLFAIGLQLALYAYYYIINIRLLQAMVGSEISS